ncbi:MAG: hypothetical protein LLG37_06490 [Spirochaetia bacterium]|nr:hypothetical protein [Spirochaetia bacterium]
MELNDKNRVYLIGRDIEGLDIKLCPDEKSTLSRIQAHIKYDKNAWRLFDGMPTENIGRQAVKISKPSSFAGSFIKRGSEFRFIPYGTGEELREGDQAYFVATGKTERNVLAKWLNRAGTDAQAAFYKYNSFNFKTDAANFDGFKYKLRVLSDAEQAAKMRANNMLVPVNFSKDFEIGKEHLNYCLGLDIRGSTGADLETQRDYWIPQFNAILNELLPAYSDYLLILLGDGAYISFLGQRDHQDVNFEFAMKFLDRMHVYNADNRKKGIPEWSIRLAVNMGKDRLAHVTIAGLNSLNVYGNAITTTSRLMSYGKSQGDEIIVGIPFHQEFNNFKYYKTNFSQTMDETTDKNNVRHSYYVYKKIGQ